MSRSTKIWLIIATALVVSGIIMFGVLASMMNWNFMKLGTVKYETKNYELVESFKNICVNTDTAEVVFLPAEDGVCRVICYEPAKAKHTVSVSDETLFINITDERKWYDYIGITFSVPKITVYLPENEYSAATVKSSTGDVKMPVGFSFESLEIMASTGDVECRSDVKGMLKIALSTGDIELENISAGDVELSVTTGDIEIDALRCDGNIKICVSTGDADLENVSCRSFASSGDTGELTLSSVIATEDFNIQRSTGNVQLYGCDAETLFIKTSTGDVRGNLLSEKVFLTKTDTGKVKIPATKSGGSCEIRTTTGNIIIDIK